MIEPQYTVFRSRVTRPLTEVERLAYQVKEGKAQVGAEAARKIARHIEEQHGFWDFEERKAAS